MNLNLKDQILSFIVTSNDTYQLTMTHFTYEHTGGSSTRGSWAGMTFTWSQILENDSRFRSLNLTWEISSTDYCSTALGKTVTEYGKDLTRDDFVDAQWKVFLRSETTMWVLVSETLLFSIDFSYEDCKYKFEPYPLVNVDLTAMSGVYNTGE